ncbi:nicotinate-nucleotide--dimethylbenzimidazole phosphoribosyltransferase [Mechercharimyces sp. CAU 1602]|uniref:nicotinate-nucleotide--dimethylbenzimidazole phosphoribosyltransferase n=1 Tax=Mechercharimyces sp. CAU 1602 TaxID=2973933 RepID=UPI0021620535|nr:nicotinate-nucleotide--dimethylbenzimidazole phosphoribosyltransferase [Mechercharimyces sp. CAU 1602]MCS1351856.1 nicotinate-nucleotide--dimethylbenzimidazole phosphoribosyltransferase [Mechercharimyces sp. CAU 1602]
MKELGARQNAEHGRFPPISKESTEKMCAYLNQLTKPRGSLGMLEEIAIRMAGITGKLNPTLTNKMVVVMCGDHGVVEEGVSAYPQEVTGWMMRNFASGGAAINVLARQMGAEVLVIDMGTKAEKIPGSVLNRKVRAGTSNLAREAAMSRDEAWLALRHGEEVIEDLQKRGIHLLAVGEMGIGNTTAATAITSVLIGLPVNQCTGFGTGLTEGQRQVKVRVIEQALRHNRPDPKDPIDILAKVGGFEIAGMVGVMIGAAKAGLPIVLDGVISSAAALLAVRMEARVQDFLFASHLSVEPAHALILQDLSLEPMLDAKLRLGEGSGAVLAFPLFDAAVAIVSEMSTFADMEKKEEGEW